MKDEKQIDLSVTGTQINYYFLCARKLWYFSHNIQMEQNNDAVYLGKLIHEYSYEREKKELDIDRVIKIDFIGKDRVIHEVKKSDRVEEPHIWQLKYYLWYLEKKGVAGVTGKINYPKLKKSVDVRLENGDEQRLTGAMIGIEKIVKADVPPCMPRMRICERCSYNDICWV